jgi:ribosomal-protein-alanine N-acetyltransferase
VKPRIRRLAKSDLARLLRLEKRAFPEDAYPREFFLELLAECGDLFLIAEIDGALAGYVVACSNELVSIAVDVRFRRRGVGAALMRRVLQVLRSRGAPRVSLMVRVGNESAMAFYRRFGFKKTGRVRHYYEKGGDAFRMTAPTGVA